MKSEIHTQTSNKKWEKEEESWFVMPPAWFLILVCNTARQSAIQEHQERVQVVRSNRVARKRPAESNTTPAMDLGFEDIR